MPVFLIVRDCELNMYTVHMHIFNSRKFTQVAMCMLPCNFLVTCSEMFILLVLLAVAIDFQFLTYDTNKLQ